MRAILDERLKFVDAPFGFIEKLVDHFKVPNPKYAQIKAFSPTGGRFTSEPEFLYGVQEFDDGTISLPRSVNIPEDILPKEAVNLVVEDERITRPCSWPKMLPEYTLNAAQQQMEDIFLKLTKKVAPPGMLFKAKTGFGKTLGMLNIAEKAGQRTLIIVHRDLIFRAWKEDAHKFYGPSLLTGIIRGQQTKIGEQVTIAMLQTLVRKTPAQLADIFSHFGTIILDEAHIVPMNMAQTVLEYDRSMFRTGCTATTQRTDNLQKILYWHFGTVCADVRDAALAEKNSSGIAKVHLINTPFEYDPEGDKGFDQEELTQNLMNDGERNELIIHNVLNDIGDRTQVLVVSTRIAHVNILADLLRKEGVNPVVLTGERRQGRKMFDRQIACAQLNMFDVICSTESLVREGANIPPLNRLHITVPMRSILAVTQLCGRLTRRYDANLENTVTIYFDTQVPSLRNRVTKGMIPALRKMDVPNLQKLYIA